MEYRKFRKQRFGGHLLSVPFIWFPLIALIFLDISVSLYQIICFPIYHLKKVKRSKYILITDRAKLSYIEPLEKLDCMYCAYANGILLYAKEIAGRTEKYWCGIKHEDRKGFEVQDSQIKQDFSDFGDEEGFIKKYGY